MGPLTSAQRLDAAINNAATSVAAFPTVDDNADRQLVGIWVSSTAANARLQLQYTGKTFIDVDLSIFGHLNGLLPLDLIVKSGIIPSIGVVNNTGGALANVSISLFYRSMSGQNPPG